MIAAQLCVGTVAAYHSGIGGGASHSVLDRALLTPVPPPGGFMLVRTPDGKYETVCPIPSLLFLV